MRKYLFAVCSAAVFALPTSAAFSQVDVEVGPGRFLRGAWLPSPLLQSLRRRRL